MLRSRRSAVLLLPTAAACVLTAVAVARAPAVRQGLAVVMQIDGPVMPPTRDCFERALQRAEAESATMLLVEMNTPGGHSEAMREIAQMILNARVPVVVYVTPSGARAASAGAVIGLSAHILAMAPGTNIGAAHPVLGTGGNIPGDMRDKVVNDMSAFVRTVAERRGKDVKWAEGIVRKSISSTESEALKAGIADLIASDRADLFRRIDGRTVTLEGGRSSTLRTSGIRTENVEPTWVERLLMLLFDGNVTLILGALAFYGLIAEIQSPGAIVPGVVGSIALVLSLYSMSVLSVNATGVALLVLAGVLFVVDLYASTHGVLTAGGAVAFVMGALMLFRNSPTGAEVSLSVVIAMMLITVGFFVFILGSVLRSRRMPASVGPEALVGLEGVARTDLNPSGKVFVDGAIWRAFNAGSDRVAAGDHVVVRTREKLTLGVVRSDAQVAEPVYRSGSGGEERQGNG